MIRRASGADLPGLDAVQRKARPGGMNLHRDVEVTGSVEWQAQGTMDVRGSRTFPPLESCPDGACATGGRRQRFQSIPVRANTELPQGEQEKAAGQNRGRRQSNNRQGHVYTSPDEINVTANPTDEGDSDTSETLRRTTGLTSDEWDAMSTSERRDWLTNNRSKLTEQRRLEQRRTTGSSESSSDSSAEWGKLAGNAISQGFSALSTYLTGERQAAHERETSRHEEEMERIRTSGQGELEEWRARRREAELELERLDETRRCNRLRGRAKTRCLAALEDAAGILPAEASTTPEYLVANPSGRTARQGDLWWRTTRDLVLSSGARVLRDLQEELHTDYPQQFWSVALLNALGAAMRPELASGSSTPATPQTSDTVVSREWLRAAIWYSYHRDGFPGDWHAITLPITSMELPRLGGDYPIPGYSGATETRIVSGFTGELPLRMPETNVTGEGEGMPVKVPRNVGGRSSKSGSGVVIGLFLALAAALASGRGAS